MWKYFQVEWRGKRYQCEAKVFDNPSMWGIREGRVSKLYVDDEPWYERGWCLGIGGVEVDPDPGLLDAVLWGATDGKEGKKGD